MAQRPGYVAVLVGIITSFSFAQCDFDWKTGQGIPGLDGKVYALTTWDPDGAGPQPELLIAGGQFTVAGYQFANNIASWDGTAWQPLGSGMNNIVYALTVFNGQLVAGGSFTTAGGVTVNRVACWDGSEWGAFSSGMDDGLVRALTIWDPDGAGSQPEMLIAGGDFLTAGTVTLNRIAVWDGIAWQPLGTGMDNVVLALTVYTGQLIAGG